MKKIKILFYSHTIDFAGTWRSHERILLNLNNDLFDVYVFYNPNKDNNRLEYLKTKLPEDRIIPFDASIDKLGPEHGYPYRTTNFRDLAIAYNFDIIHFARSGYFEWPFNQRIAPIQIETNIFGFSDSSGFLDCSVAICDTIKRLRGGANYTVYNPIPFAEKNKEVNLKKIYNIGDDEIVFGRIGRKDNFHPIALESVYKIKEIGVKFKYIIVGACDHTKNKINQLNLTDNCILVETTNEDNFIDRFHNTIDIFLHYRSDGECHSTAISQAMMYGIPIISHFAGYNGQEETIRDGGYVVSSVNEYTESILKLINDKSLYDSVSNNAKNRAMVFEEKKIIGEWEKIYINEYKKLPQ
jgi:hypothetical protein